MAMKQHVDSHFCYIPKDNAAKKFAEATAGGLKTLMPTGGVKIFRGRQLPRHTVLSLCFMLAKHEKRLKLLLSQSSQLVKRDPEVACDVTD